MIVGDDKAGITAAIRTMKEQGCELILATGGMSVDPDDQTPGAIKDSGGGSGPYGGARYCRGRCSVLAYFPDGTPVMGLPGCVMYAKTTIFDLMLHTDRRGSKGFAERDHRYLETAACALDAENAGGRPGGFGTA